MSRLIFVRHTRVMNRGRKKPAASSPVEHSFLFGFFSSSLFSKVEYVIKCKYYFLY